MDAIILNREDLQQGDGTQELQGYTVDANVCVILVDMQPGEGVRLHSHPYEEVFVVQEGQATYTVGAQTLEVKAGQIVIVPPAVPHKFVNSGTSPLRQVDIHVSPRFQTDWLES